MEVNALSIWNHLQNRVVSDSVIILFKHSSLGGPHSPTEFSKNVTIAIHAYLVPNRLSIYSTPDCTDTEQPCRFARRRIARRNSTPGTLFYCGFDIIYLFFCATLGTPTVLRNTPSLLPPAIASTPILKKLIVHINTNRN